MSKKNFASVVPGSQKSAWRNSTDRRAELATAAVVIAAITSCTNTSNPSVMLAAGLVAKKAVERGLKVEAVGEDQSRAGIEGGDGLLSRSRA